MRWGGAVEPKPQQCFGVDNVNDHFSDLPKFALIGIPREPMDFVQRACSLVHPVLRAMQVGSPLLDAIDLYSDGDGLGFRRIQCGFSQALLRMACEMKDEEAKQHAELPVHLQRVLKGKRLGLFKRLLLDCDYPDAKVADEMALGFPLCGWLPSLRPPDIHVSRNLDEDERLFLCSDGERNEAVG